MRYPFSRTFTLTLVVATSVLAMVVAGCGSSEDEETSLSAEQVAAFASSYCVTARNWAAHELNGDGDQLSANPVAFEKY